MNPLWEKREAIADLDTARAIVDQAVAEGRSLTGSELRIVKAMREEGQVRLTRAEKELQRAFQSPCRV